MRRVPAILFLAVLCGCVPRGGGEETAELRVEGAQFVLSTDGGEVLRSADLVGASFEMALEDGGAALVRIDGVEPAPERASVLLHTLSLIDPVSGAARPLCGEDAQGRRAGFPAQGRFDDEGRYHDEPGAWLLTCTSGSQGKCVLWGYAPWEAEDRALGARLYEACQRVARADYAGDLVAHTKEGTLIDLWDDAGVQAPSRDPKFVFEAGWGPGGAVCVARTRWPDLLALEDLHRARPDLAGECTEATARAMGAILYSAVIPR